LSKPIRVLILEDSIDDASLLVRQLQVEGYDPTYERVETAAALRAALTRQTWDLILADYSLPSFSALEALALVHELQLNLPFIILSGTVNEATAVSALKAGAHDFITKGNWARLGPAIARELREAEGRRQHQQAEAALAANERRFRALIEHSADAISLLDADRRLIYASPATTRVLGYASEEVVGMDLSILVHPEDRPAVETLLAEVRQTPGGLVTAQCRMRHQQGAWRWREASIDNLLAEPSVAAIVINFRDVTERRRAEDRLRLTDEILRRIQSLVILTDRNGAVTFVSEASGEILGYGPTELLGDRWWQATYDEPAAAAAARESVARAARGELTLSTEPYENQLQTRTGATRVFLWQVAQGPADTLIAIGHDITERKLRERELEAIAAVSAALRAAATRAEMLPIILQQVLGLLSADGAALGILDPASGETVVELAGGNWAGDAGIRVPPGQSDLAQVIATGRPFVAEAARLDAHYFGTQNVIRVGWVAIVPLMARSQAIGALWTGRLAAFSASEARVLSAIADIAASAIQRFTLYEETERNLQRLAALRAIDAAISASLDLRLTLNMVVEQVVTQLRVDAADVLLLDPISRTLEYAAGRGFRLPVLGHSRWKASQGYPGRAVAERRTISLPDLAAAEPDPLRGAALAHENFQAYYGVPLISKGRVVGVIEIFQRAPLHPDAEWLSFLEALSGQAGIAIDSAKLFDDLQRSNLDLGLAYEATIEGWSRAMDLRDKETEGHTQRVTEMTMRLGRALGLSEDELVHIRRGALLHDIGKMGVPDQILLKPGPLTDEEWAIMRRHPLLAYAMLLPIAYLRPALDIPYCHHEKWDGTGYPRGLRGESIPRAARVFAVVDVWDALRSVRPYRPAWPEDRVRDHIRSLSGSHFDPQAAEAFLELEGMP
jgi:PAS domain S-box-containing protein